MKTSRIVTTALIASALFSATLLAKDAKPNGQKKELTREEIAKLGGFEPAADAHDAEVKDVVVDLFVASVPDTAAVSLIEELRDATKADAAFRKLQGLIETKKARLIGWPTMQTKPGQRSVLENIIEVRYAIEFDPNPAGAAPANGDGKGDAAAQAAQPPGPAAPPAVGVLPTTFETRNAGLTLEVEPLPEMDGKEISVNLSGQHVMLQGWEPCEVKENEKTIFRVPQPRFHSNRVTTNLSVENGKRVLVGVFRSGDNKEETELFLFRATTKLKKAK